MIAWHSKGFGVRLVFECRRRLFLGGLSRHHYQSTAVEAVDMVVPPPLVVPAMRIADAVADVKASGSDYAVARPSLG